MKDKISLFERVVKAQRRLIAAARREQRRQERRIAQRERVIQRLGRLAWPLYDELEKRQAK